MFAAAATGFLASMSLLLAVGAQTAFVLRQGLRGRHVLPLVFLCAVSDATLILIGVLGAGWLITLHPALPAALSLAGAGFMLIYGGLRFRAAWFGLSHPVEGRARERLATVLLTGLALVWLSPHVFLDTVGVIGPLSARFIGTYKLAFTLGSMSASFLFYFSLGFGARLLAPRLQSHSLWRWLDAVTGLVMWAIALGLLLEI